MTVILKLAPLFLQPKIDIPIFVRTFQIMT